MSEQTLADTASDRQTNELADQEWEKLRRAVGFTPADANAAEATAAAVEGSADAAPPQTVYGGTRYTAAGSVVEPISRVQAVRMGYNQYAFAESERSRLTWEGMQRELSPAEVKRLRQATAAVHGYLDYIFGPEPVAVSIAPARKSGRKLGKAGRLGRLVNRR